MSSNYRISSTVVDIIHHLKKSRISWNRNVVNDVSK